MLPLFNANARSGIRQLGRWLLQPSKSRPETCPRLYLRSRWALMAGIWHKKGRAQSYISTCRYLGLLYWSLLCILYIVFNQRLICDFLLIALFWLPQRVRQRQPQFQHHVHLKRWRCGSAGQPNNPLMANCSRHFGIMLVMLDNAWH